MTDINVLTKLLRAMASGKAMKEGHQDVILLEAAKALEAYTRLPEGAQPIAADGVRVARCDDPQCAVCHLALVDEDNRIVATAILNEKAVGRLVKWCRENGVDPEEDSECG